jgi:hypothetical protein
VLRPAPPVIARQSGDTTVPIGGTALFRISASGLQPLSYQWYRNGKAVRRATKASYPLTADNLGAAITVKVTGRKAGYTTRSSVSVPTAKVA